MNTKPFLHALGAALYIVLIVNVIHAFADATPKEDTILAPITMLSLFVLSAAVMGFLFVYKPLTLYVDGQKQEALSFFLKTLGSFAVFVALFVASLLVVSGKFI